MIKKPRKSPWRFQFRLVNWFWVSLVLAAFFLGRQWDDMWRGPATGKVFFGESVTSDAGVTGMIVIDEANFSRRPQTESSND